MGKLVEGGAEWPRIIVWRYYKLDHPTGQKIRKFLKIWNGIIAILVSFETLQETIEEDEIKTFTAVIVDSLAGLEELMAIKEYLIPHTNFLWSNDWSARWEPPSVSEGSLCCADWFFKSRTVALYPFQKALFSGQYGDKMSPFTTQVNPKFYWWGDLPWSWKCHFKRWLWSRF